MAGTVACRVSPAREVMGRSTSRWPLSKEWVVTPFLTSDTQRMAPACGVVIVTVWPWSAVAGAAASWGRGPRNR
ncbi:MAG: hypothetical protein K0S88_5304 [Actinomycetia bacterium]|nr:hypothetical protein [Actinomycetes bacterium]